MATDEDTIRESRRKVLGALAHDAGMDAPGFLYACLDNIVGAYKVMGADRQRLLDDVGLAWDSIDVVVKP